MRRAQRLAKLRERPVLGIRHVVAADVHALFARRGYERKRYDSVERETPRRTNADTMISFHLFCPILLDNNVVNYTKSWQTAIRACAQWSPKREFHRAKAFFSFVTIFQQAMP